MNLVNHAFLRKKKIQKKKKHPTPSSSQSKRQQKRKARAVEWRRVHEDQKAQKIAAKHARIRAKYAEQPEAPAEESVQE